MKRTVEIVAEELKRARVGTTRSKILTEELLKLAEDDIEEAEKRIQARKENDDKSPKE